jgi:hypothetical protein
MKKPKLAPIGYARRMGPATTVLGGGSDSHDNALIHNDVNTTRRVGKRINALIGAGDFGSAIPRTRGPAAR